MTTHLIPASSLTQTTEARRAGIIRQLNKQEWFRRSPARIQRKLALLPSTFQNPAAGGRTEPLYWDDVLEDLLRLHHRDAHRDLPKNAPTLERITDVLISEAHPYGMSIVAEVTQANGITVPRQWFTWHRGLRAGGKGVLLVRKQGVNEISDVVFLQGVSIPLHQVVFDCPGGGRDGDELPEQTFVRETEEEVGVPPHEIEALYELGTFFPDASAMFQQPRLFAATISTHAFLEYIQPRRRSTKELGDLDAAPAPIVCPVAALGQEIETLSQDAYAATILLRLHAYQRAIGLTFSYPKNATPRVIELEKIRQRP